jgi:3-hydroxyacyl-[acyl-carrier-protein] dehydratase
VTEAANTLCVPAGHPVLAGHFPGRPIVPGVMLLEWVLREAGHRLDRNLAELRIRECKFVEPLLPTETATLSMRIDAGRCFFTVQRGTAILATGVVVETS